MIYLIGNASYGPIKIGYSKDPKKRICSIQTGYPYKLKILKQFKGDLKEEKKIHENLSFARLNGEWFKRYSVANYFHLNLPLDEERKYENEYNRFRRENIELKERNNFLENELFYARCNKAIDMQPLQNDNIFVRFRSIFGF